MRASIRLRKSRSKLDAARRQSRKRLRKAHIGDEFLFLRPNTRFVPTKVVEQKNWLMLHRARHLFIRPAGAQRSVLGGKIADTRRPGPPPVGGGTRLWYSCYDIFQREGQPMAHKTPPFSADAALRHFRSYFTEPKDVVAHPQLSRDEKLAILREWEQDALRLSTSESEGMGGGEESMLGRVEESIGILERSPR